VSLAVRLALFGLVAAAALFAVAGAVLAGMLGYLGGSTTVHPKGNYSVSEARSYAGFPVFYPGESIGGHQLTAVARDPLGPMRKNQESVEFMYGTCEIPAGMDGGCSLPVSVSNEPACSRNLSMYSGPLSPKPGRTRVRGTTAAFFEGGSRLEIQTGTTTVVIFAFSKQKALSVAESLRGVNVPVSAHDPLPPPARGAVEGSLGCPRKLR
jgi:hypothetical protein